MTKIVSQYGIVNLDNVRLNSIVHINLDRILTESIFEQQYKMAARIIAEIIHESDVALNVRSGYCCGCPRNNCDGCTYQGSRRLAGEGNVEDNLTSFHTAVPFIGGRGTGKTSVMKSVWARLRSYSGTDSEAAFYLGADYNRAQFVTLEMIDAGMLKTTDDVLEIILAQMLGYLESIQKDNDFLDLYRQIDELHKDLCYVYEEERKAENFGLTSLQRVSDSRHAITKFQQLVQEFISTMSIHRFNRQPCYLVVALDDIDMYQGSNCGMKNTQFALLEHIYCHLRIPGLIVLMTFNEHLLKRACNRHFEEIYFGGRIKRAYTATEQQDIEGLTAQFMSKLFPQEKRIYMPNYMLVDALDRPNLYVKPALNGRWLDPFSETEISLPVKEFMLRLIAHKTDVYFDAAGTKKHFFEPRNLRELGELFQFVDSMENIPKEEERKIAVQTRNRQRLLDYLKNQFALRYLDAEEYEEFAGLLTLPLWRQDRTLIDKIRLQRQQIATEPDDFGYLSGSKEDRWRYSYGELLHNIYFSTRISKTPGGSDPYFRKEFMRCIFGTHSVQMNEAVHSTQSRKDMLKVVGSSLAGRWANKMLPKLYLPDFEEPGGAGSISLPVRDFFDWQIPEKAQEAIQMLCQGLYAKAEKELFQFMEALVVVGLFFTNVPAHGLGVRLDVGTDERDEVVLCLRSDSNEQICFNVLNFAINLYDALPEKSNKMGGYLSDIQDKLTKLGKNFIESIIFPWDDKVKQADAIITELTSEERRSKRMYMSPHIVRREEQQIKAAKSEKETAELWSKLQKICLKNFNANKFLNTWNTVLQNVISKYSTSISRWRNEYGQYQWVLPVQNFDMMYNINKRLANVSYHDIPDEAYASEVYAHYVRLYHSLAAELENQDRVYYGDKPGKFSKTFQDCIFYSVITNSVETESGELNENYNPFIEEVLVSTVSSTVVANATRKRVGAISL